MNNDMPFLDRYKIPLKFHYFSYYFAFGSLYPMLSVILSGRGLSDTELGLINAVVPFLLFFTNPLAGFIADHSRRYLFIFSLALIISNVIYGSIFLLKPIERQPFTGILNVKNPTQPSLDFCPSKEFVNVCETSKCNCAYSANCKGADHQPINFDFFFNQTLNQQNSTSNQCEMKYQIEVKNQLPSPVSKDLNCIVSCSNEKVCGGTRSNDQIYHILLYSILYIIGHNIFCNTITLGTSLGFASLSDPKTFGEQRLWGTIGFGIAMIIAGRANAYFKSELVYIIMFIVASLICVVDTTRIRIKPRNSSQRDENDSPWSTLSALLPVLKNVDAFVFLSLAFIWGTSYAILDPYIYLYVDHIEPCDSRQIISYMGFCASLAEIIAFFLAGKILEALGVNFCSILILLAFAVRFAGYYLIPVPIYLTLIESMHFFNFGIFYVLVAKEADALAPPGLSGTLQGFAYGICFGLGRGSALLVASVIFERSGFKNLFFVFSCFNVIAAVVYSFYFLAKRFLVPKKKPNHDQPLKVIVEAEEPNEAPLLN